LAGANELAVGCYEITREEGTCIGDVTRVVDFARDFARAPEE
jgi:hypothetical protein